MITRVQSNFILITKCMGSSIRLLLVKAPPVRERRLIRGVYCLTLTNGIKITRLITMCDQGGTEPFGCLRLIVYAFGNVACAASSSELGEYGSCRERGNGMLIESLC